MTDHVIHNIAHMAAVVAVETEHEREQVPGWVCRNCRVRGKAPGFETCTPCFFYPQRWRV